MQYWQFEIKGKKLLLHRGFLIDPREGSVYFLYIYANIVGTVVLTYIH